jgi:exodeoxyribonuclease VII large subunit
VHDFATRLDTAREHIARESQAALSRHHQLLNRAASDIAASRTTIARQEYLLSRIGNDVAGLARESLARQRIVVEGLREWFSAVDVTSTLQRGFSLVTTPDETTVIRSVRQIAPGDRLKVRLGDGTVLVTVDES